MPTRRARARILPALALLAALGGASAAAEESPTPHPPEAEQGQALEAGERPEGYLSNVTKKATRKVTEAFAEAERVWALRESADKARQARDGFRAIVGADPELTDGWLRLAEANWWLAELEEVPDADPALEHLEACYEAGLRAVVLDRFEPRAYYWAAKCLNSRRLASGLVESALRLNETLRLLHEAEKMDRDMMHGDLYALRARIIHEATPPARLFMNDGPKDALKLLKKQEEIAQGCFAARTLHGDVLLSLGRRKDARAQWEYVLRTPANRSPECYHENLKVQERLRLDFERARRASGK